MKNFRSQALSRRLSLIVMVTVAAALTADTVGSQEIPRPSPLVLAQLPEPPERRGADLGDIGMDLPYEAVVGEPFQADVFLRPKDPKFDGTATVYMEQTSEVRYEPRRIELRPGERETVTIKIVKSDGGLTQVIGWAERWAPAVASIKTGFASKLHANLEPALESYLSHPFTIDLIDSHGERVPLGAPVELLVTASQAVIRKTGDKEWKSSLSLNLERGATSAPDMEIMPKTFSLANATVSAKLRINGNRTLLEDRFQTRALPRWWIQLLMAVIGGLLWSIYQVVAPAEPASTKRRRLLARVAVGIIAGIAAYLLASYDILGIKADTSSLRAFVVLGFLFSFVGIEGVLSKMLPRKP